MVHSLHVSQSSAQVHLCLSTLSWPRLSDKERFVVVVCVVVVVVVVIVVVVVVVVVVVIVR